MASVAGYLIGAAALSAADRFVTSPVFRWTWQPFSEESFRVRLPEIRPIDPPAAGDMLAGKYLLGSRLMETGGVSPFSVATDDVGWHAELHGFAWLRHFSESKSGRERQFARTLVLDWIGRHGRFDRRTWRNSLTGRRVQNWLTHYGLIIDGASAKQRGIIARCLSAQIHALGQRGRLDPEPIERLGAAIALVAAALSRNAETAQLAKRTRALARQLADQLDANGLHRSRCARNQFELLQYLVPVRLALVKMNPDAARALGALIDRMHAALAVLTLTTGEPAYFNGTGQLPLELVLAVQSHGAHRAEGNRTSAASGYGLMRQGQAKLVSDGGSIPPVEFSRAMHAGALAFEFSWGNDLIVGNCGPAPAQLARQGIAFRQSAAHSTLELPDISSARFGFGPFAHDRLLARSRSHPVRCDPKTATLAMGSTAYVRRFDLRHSRALTLIDDGQTLVGQDTLSRAGRGRPQISAIPFVFRFHLAPGSLSWFDGDQSFIRLTTQSGESWVFLWEGGEASIEPSVRQSLHYALVDTQQIALRGEFSQRSEIAWSFARQSG